MDGQKIKGYNILDFTLTTTKKLSKTWELSLNVENILDEDGMRATLGDSVTYQVAGFVPRRNWNVQVSFNF